VYGFIESSTIFGREKMKEKVFVTRKIPEEGIKLLKKKFQVRIYPQDKVISQKELLKGVKWCDALLCLLTDKIDSKVLRENPNLKVVSNYAVGYNNIDIKSATSLRIPITNTPGVLTDAVAEHTLALMMSVARRIPESDKFVRSGKYTGWKPLLLLGTQLKGKTLGIVGLGRIGISVAERAIKGMGMKVVYHNRSRRKDFEKKFGAKYANLNSLLKKSDFISLHVPLLPSTKHLIGSKELGLMKKTAYLINTSRGPIVNEKSLVSALKSRKIAGAALDVFENEPKLSAGLSKLNNVVLTPHTASATFEARSAMSIIAAENIIAVLKGKKAKFTVNSEVYGGARK
jgi:glyoxylate reductase